MSTGDGSYHAALASARRREVLDCLKRAPQPLDAPAIAGMLGLHVTTVRFHLDQLQAAGLVERSVAAAKRRGRPRVLYAVAGDARDDSSREQLIAVLAHALAGEPDGSNEAVRAGARWAESFSPLDPDRRESGLVAVLQQLGFGPELAGETIALRTCPFRDAARAHPDVVCSVHSGLIDRLLERPEGAEPALAPFVEPELCLVALGSKNQDRPA